MRKVLQKICEVFAICSVMHRLFTKCEQFYWLPKFSFSGAGYPKRQKGIIVMWLGWCKQIRKPIND